MSALRAAWAAVRARPGVVEVRSPIPWTMALCRVRDPGGRESE